MCNSLDFLRKGSYSGAPVGVTRKAQLPRINSRTHSERHRPASTGRATSKSRCDDADEETFFSVSDEALERACGSHDASLPTLVGTYCFTCPTGQDIEMRLP